MLYWPEYLHIYIVLKEAFYRKSDEDGNKDGTNRVGDRPIEGPHQDGADNDPDTAQGVGQDVQEYALNFAELI